MGRCIATARLKVAAIYSSEWRRCLETVLLFDLGAVSWFNGLNSFYQNSAERDASLANLTAKLNSLPREDTPVIMVTHYVVIQAIATIAVSSGGPILYDLTSGHTRELSVATFGS